MKCSFDKISAGIYSCMSSLSHRPLNYMYLILLTVYWLILADDKERTDGAAFYIRWH